MNISKTGSEVKSERNVLPIVLYRHPAGLVLMSGELVTGVGSGLPTAGIIQTNTEAILSELCVMTKHKSISMIFIVPLDPP